MIRPCSIFFAVLCLTQVIFAQGVYIPPTENNFDVMLKAGGIVDLHTLEELNQNQRVQTESRSSATLSKLDLKASGRARTAYANGLRRFATKDYKNAAQNFEKAISLYPDFVSAHNALGCAYFSLGENDRALEHFNRAIALDDHLSASFMNRGRVELAMGRAVAAQASFEKASSIAPLDSNLLLALAYSQYLNRDYSGVERTTQQAHSHPHMGIATIHYFAAASWQAQNNLDNTRRELQTFLTEDPTSPFADTARHSIQQIDAAAAQPTLALANSAPVFASDAATPSKFGEKALQDFRQKQQIAEAEAAEAPCLTCNEVDSAPSYGINGTRSSTSVANGKAFTFRSSVDEVAVFFTVTDHGRSVTDLKQSEIVLSDNGKPPSAVVGFHTESDLPLRLGLVIDTSTSVTGRITFEQAAASDFLKQVLTNNDDLGFLVGFSDQIVLGKDFTHDVKELSRVVEQLVPVGGTAIWDAVSFAADKLATRQETQPVARVLVVISDGDDNSSRSTLKQAIERAQRDEVAVYTVSTRYVDPQNDLESPGNQAMKTLAQLTGGSAFFPGHAARLKGTLADLQQVIRSRYLISYRPAEFHPDGTYRTLEIVARRSGRKFKVNARRGYTAN